MERSLRILFTATLCFFSYFTVQTLKARFNSPIEISDHRQKQKITILMFGDAGQGNKDQLIVGKSMFNTCSERNCDFAIMAGDNIYPSGISSPNDPQMIKKFETPYSIFGRFDFWVVAGNHDWYGGTKSVQSEVAYTNQSLRWRMPALNYAIPNLPVWLNIYGIDSDKLTQQQIDQSSSLLCSAQGWKIMFGHHPIYSNGMHGDTDKIKKAVVPMMQKCGVQFYLAGHDHHQEHLTGQGFETIVQGTAAEKRSVKTKTYKPGQAYKQNFAVSRLGYSILEFTQQTASISFYNELGQIIYNWQGTPDSTGKLPQN